tara:strand:+ start:282 stop:512 length:231 start_codon:yes stop_codon:yes gene_type:complete
MISIGKTENSITIQILRYFYITLMKTSYVKATSHTIAIGVFSFEFAFCFSRINSDYKEKEKEILKSRYKVKPTYEA